MVFADGGGSISPAASPHAPRLYPHQGRQRHDPQRGENTPGEGGSGGREVSGRVGSPTRHPHHHSSQSSVTTPTGGYPAQLPSPYGVNAKANDFLHKAGDFNNPVDLDPRYRRKEKHRKHRHSSKSPTTPPGGASERSHSPGALSAGSRRSQDSRNQSFKKAISNNNPRGPAGVPLADEEDLSPVSPDTPTRREQIGFAPRTHTGRGAEVIPMGDYGKSRNRFRDSGIADTHIGSPDSNPKQTLLPQHGGGTAHTEPRPPVEGRDSVRGRREPHYPPPGTTTTAGPITTPDRQNGNFISGKPGLKPLPLRNVQRPDGQSPSTKPRKHPSATRTLTPTLPDSSGLSPILRKTQLFDNDSKASSAVHTPIDVPDEYEYDDYMPNLPGSYFTMDPHAYTLTWSNQQPWNAQHKVPPTTSDPSVNESHA